MVTLLPCINDPLCSNLVECLQKQTGLQVKVTNKSSVEEHWRLLERGVVYGAMFPDSIDTMQLYTNLVVLDDLFQQPSTLKLFMNWSNEAAHEKRTKTQGA